MSELLCEKYKKQLVDFVFALSDEISDKLPADSLTDFDIPNESLLDFSAIILEENYSPIDLMEHSVRIMHPPVSEDKSIKEIIKQRNNEYIVDFIAGIVNIHIPEGEKYNEKYKIKYRYIWMKLPEDTKQNIWIWIDLLYKYIKKYMKEKL